MSGMMRFNRFLLGYNEWRIPETKWSNVNDQWPLCNIKRNRPRRKKEWEPKSLKEYLGW